MERIALATISHARGAVRLPLNLSSATTTFTPPLYAGQVRETREEAGDQWAEHLHRQSRRSFHKP
jgi:hypothetical protein